MTCGASRNRTASSETHRNLPSDCANRAFLPLPKLATCSCKTFRGSGMGVPQSLAFACLSYVGNDRKRGNNLLLKYENETPEAFFLISVKKCYPLCATLPLAHGARIFFPLCRRIRKTRRRANLRPRHSCLSGEAPERLLFGFPIRQ